MNDPNQLPFPYKPPAIHVKQSTRKLEVKETIKRPIEKYGWISEGSLKPIEKGLPLIFGTKFSHSFEDIEIAHKRFTDFVQKYKKFKAGDELDVTIENDEDDEDEEVEENEENNDPSDDDDEIDLEQVYNPFKFILDRVAPKEEEVEETQPRRTGINTPSLETRKNANKSIINSMSPIKFSSVKPSHEIKKPLYMNPFYHPQINKKVRVPTKSTVPLLKQQLQRVFQPDGVPFENVDKSEDFPTTMLLPMIDDTTSNKRGKSELSMYKRKGKIINPKSVKKAPKSNDKKVTFPNNTESEADTSLLITEMRPDMYSKDTFLDDQNENKNQEQNDDELVKPKNNSNKSKYDDLKDVPSTLIDPTKDDIFWTKNKVPFTREDINHIFSWQIQNDAIMTMVDEKRQKKLDEREKALMTTLESKKAFEHAIDLVDKECERIVKVGPGKSEKNKQSFWIKAAKYAKNDKSSLQYRKKKWNEFVNEVQKSFKLLVNQNKNGNKEENFYSSPYFSSISQSNTNLNTNLTVASSKPALNSTNENINSTNENVNSNDKNENLDDDVYNDNIMIGNKPKSNNDDNKKYNGLMKNQVDFILSYKAEIMSGREVNSTTFWNVLKSFQAVDFTHTEFCILVEILRHQLNVTKSEVLTYLDEKDYPSLFYHLVLTSPDFQVLSDDNDEMAQKIKKKKKKELFSDNKSSSVFETMQKKQQILEQNKAAFETLPH